MEWKFTLGVGGAVVRDGQLLLVHHAYGAKMWQIPGGYVKPEECAHEGVVREIYEETGIRAAVDGLLGVRHRVKEGDNSTYLIFRLTPVELHDPIPDGREVDALDTLPLRRSKRSHRTKFLRSIGGWLGVFWASAEYAVGSGRPRWA